MISHSDREGNDCIRKLRCHCIQIMHSDIYSGRYLESFRQGQKLVIILENELFQNLNLEQF